MYKLKITAKAKKELRNISKTYEQQAINNSLLDIKENPYIGKPLARGLTGKFSYKVGVYRIIYRINAKDKVISVLTAGHRSIVYK